MGLVFQGRPSKLEFIGQNVKKEGTMQKKKSLKDLERIAFVSLAKYWSNHAETESTARKRATQKEPFAPYEIFRIHRGSVMIFVPTSYNGKTA